MKAFKNKWSVLFERSMYVYAESEEEANEMFWKWMEKVMENEDEKAKALADGADGEFHYYGAYEIDEEEEPEAVEELRKDGEALKDKERRIEFFTRLEWDY